MVLTQKQHRAFRLLIVVIIGLIIAMLIYVALNKDKVNSYVQRKILRNPNYRDYRCPDAFAIYQYADSGGTLELDDDDVYIVILNNELREYNAKIYVNEILQAELVLKAGNTTSFISEMITRWWRQGVSEPEQQLKVEEEENSIEDNDEDADSRTFFIDIEIEGCGKDIKSLSPTRPDIAVPVSFGGGGGGDEGDSSSPSSRYSLDISRNNPLYVPD